MLRIAVIYGGYFSTNSGGTQSTSLQSAKLTDKFFHYPVVRMLLVACLFSMAMSQFIEHPESKVLEGLDKEVRARFQEWFKVLRS